MISTFDPKEVVNQFAHLSLCLGSERVSNYPTQESAGFYFQTIISGHDKDVPLGAEAGRETCDVLGLLSTNP